MKNKRFWFTIGIFTLTVPGFILFSYWYLGIFSPVRLSAASQHNLTVIGGEVSGDYNKTGAEVVKTRRLLEANGFACEPVLIYYENAITTGKPYLRSVGGCSLPTDLPARLSQELLRDGRQKRTVQFARGVRIETYAQTAVGLRKVWTEIARLSEQGRQLQFPLVQRIRDDGTNEFLIGEK
ncbi:MAG: hypothetical protein ACOY5B_14975 [Spirochaetota bacterium]